MWDPAASGPGTEKIYTRSRSLDPNHEFRVGDILPPMLENIRYTHQAPIFQSEGFRCFGEHRDIC